MIIYVNVMLIYVNNIEKIILKIFNNGVIFKIKKIVTIITIVISGSQTSLHSQDILTLDR